MTKLSVNLNKVALLRNSRPAGIPDLLSVARAAIEAGAHGITVHPRPDGRHIRTQDVYDLAKLLREEYNRTEYNIEGNPFMGGLLDLVLAVRPTQCTLVPDDPKQSTSDHGWDPEMAVACLKSIIGQLQRENIRVSIFMDPVAAAIRQLATLGADRVELYTFNYNRAYGSREEEAVLERFRLAAEAARQVGLGVNAGHDLNLQNLGPFLKHVPGVLEVSIGHAFIADALLLGIGGAVRRYIESMPS